MTISVEEYFRLREDDRKKETRYLNVINKDACTSCTSCAAVCPVDCIYEVPSSVPGQSYHQIDTSRCIGCQMCYRSPSDSNPYYQLTICPWNAIDMLHNPNVKPDAESVLSPYYRGDRTDLHWAKLEEYAYQFFLDGEVFLPKDRDDLHGVLRPLTEVAWMYSETDDVAILHPRESLAHADRYHATEPGRNLLDVIFQHWHRLFMD